MQLFVKKGITVVALVLVILILLLALGIAAMRTLAPMGGKYADNIQYQVSQLIGRPVQIGHLIFTVDGITPTARLSDLIIYSKDGGRPEMSFREMDITLDMLSSAVKLDWIPSRVVLRGSKIRIDRTLEGRFIVSGFEFGAENRGNNENYALDILNDLTFKVEDLDVFWNDVPLGLEYELHTDDMEVYLASDRFSINGSVVLPEGIDSEVDLAIDVRGPVTEYRKWQGVFSATTEDLNLLGLPFELVGDLPMVLQSGEAQIQLSGNWQGQSKLVADVVAQASNVSIDPDKSSSVDRAVQVKELSSNIQIVLDNNQWRIKSDQLNLVVDEFVWPQTGFKVQFSHQQEVLRDFAANIDFVDITTLSDLLTGLLPDSELVKIAGRHRPRGNVSNLRVKLAEISSEKVVDLEASADFSDLSWQQFEKIPGLDKIAGSVNFTDQGGEAFITGASVTYSSESMFDDPLEFEELLAQVSWDLSERDQKMLTLQQLQVSNSDISVEGSGSLILSGESPPLVDLQLTSPGIDLDDAGKYLPKVIKPKVREWLKNGLLGGRSDNAVFSLHGPLSKHAFASRELKLDGTVNAKDVRVHYLNDYPDIHSVNGKVHFLDYGVRADLSSGSVSESTIRSGYVKIDNFFKGIVELDVSTEGTAVGAVAYLKNAKFSQNLVPFLETVSTSGPVSLNLQIAVPLGKMRETNERVIKGAVGLKGNRLAIPKSNLAFINTTGTLNFNGANYSGDNIKAEFRGKPVIGKIATKPDRELHVSVSGKMQVAELLPNNALLTAITRGSAPWHATVVLPSRADARNGVGQKLILRSGLIGTALDLPTPVGKTAAEMKPLKIETGIGAGSRIAKISYGDDLRAEMQLVEKAGGYGILHADITCGDTRPNLSNNGFSLSGECGDLELEKWISRIRELSTRKIATGNSPIRVDANFERILFAGQDFKNVDLALVDASEYWDLTLGSEQIGGVFNLPYDLGETRKIIANLDRLHISATDEGGGGLSPKLIPGLDVSIKEFVYNEKNLGGVRLNSARLPQGMQIESLNLLRPDMVMKITGSWNELDEKSSVSQLEFDIDGADFGDLISDFGISQNMKSANGTLSADVSWQGAPYSIDFKTLSGVLNTNLRGGSLRDVEPGLARVFGLINFDSLPKRIALQFSDVAGEGFHFDKLQGRVAIDKGVANLDSFQIESDAANLELVGQVDTAQKTYDLDLAVVPNLTTAVPLATTLIAGPQTGVLVYLLDKVTQGAGVDLNKSITQSYLINGPWDAPEIEQVKMQQIDQEEDNLFDGD